MVLLVVDAQNGIVDERLYEFRKFVGNIKKLIGAAREQGIEVIYVQHDDGPGTGFSIGDDEFEVYSEFKPMPDEKLKKQLAFRDPFDDHDAILSIYEGAYRDW